MPQQETLTGPARPLDNWGPHGCGHIASSAQPGRAAGRLLRTRGQVACLAARVSAQGAILYTWLRSPVLPRPRHPASPATSPRSPGGTSSTSCGRRKVRGGGGWTRPSSSASFTTWTRSRLLTPGTPRPGRTSCGTASPTSTGTTTGFSATRGFSSPTGLTRYCSTSWPSWPTRWSSPTRSRPHGWWPPSTSCWHRMAGNCVPGRSCLGALFTRRRGPSAGRRG